MSWNWLEEITPTITSTVPEGYEGACKLVIGDSGGNRPLAVFPSFAIASGAAKMAVNPTLGGYCEVSLEPTDEAVTFEAALDWLVD